MHFSIIIPAKNEEATIGRCLDSVVSIDYDRREYEIIVVDNGSTDRTVEIAGGKGARVYERPELTISGLRNFGAAQASGDILAFLDADCTVDHRWLHEAARYLADEQVSCFGSPPRVPEDATWVQKAWFQVRKKKNVAGPTEWLESMNMFVRRDAFIDIGGFDELLLTCEDYDLSLRLKNAGDIFNDNRIIAVHHGEAATIVQFIRKEFWRGTSNLSGIRQHGLTIKEIPSLVAPTVHCLLVLALLSIPFFSATVYSSVVASCFLAWQVLLMVMSFRKNEDSILSWRGLQLFFLVNIYLAVRGMAVLQRK